MKIYLITTTTGDKWETSEGVCVISAKSKSSAIKIFNTKIMGEEIVEVQLLKSVNEKIQFRQSPSIE